MRSGEGDDGSIPQAPAMESGDGVSGRPTTKSEGPSSEERIEPQRSRRGRVKRRTRGRARVRVRVRVQEREGIQSHRHGGKSVVESRDSPLLRIGFERETTLTNDAVLGGVF